MKIASDASKCDLGAVILQQHDGELQPVAHAPIAMTSAETRYVQIEKEILSIMFVFHQLELFILYGQTVIAETDHKPRVNLFHKSLRIQKHIIRL